MGIVIGIKVLTKEELGNFYEIYNVQRYEIYNVQRYEIDTKTGFLKINYENGKVYFFKLREIIYFMVF